MASVLPILARPRILAATLCTALIQTWFLAVPPAAQAQAQVDPGPGGPRDVQVPRVEPALPEALFLEGPARPGRHLGVVGPESAWLGFETGEGEVWTHPMKVARDIRLSFSVPQYADPVPGDRIATRVQAAPGHAVVTYSHEGFVVHQHILAPGTSLESWSFWRWTPSST